MTVLSSISTTVYIYLIIIIGLLILDVILTVLSIKTHKRVKIKKDFLELEKLDEDKEEPINDEIMAIFEQMEKDSQLQPEEVVQRFEDEQEKNAIISYQELVDSVQNNQVDIIEDDNGEVDFVKQLELEFDTEPVVKVEDSLDKNMSLKTDNESPTHLDIVDELNNDKTFVNSEVISPVFGRISNFNNYSLNKDNTVEIKQVAGTSPEEEIKKNEAFLKALIEFRNNL